MAHVEHLLSLLPANADELPPLGPTAGSPDEYGPESTALRDIIPGPTNDNGTIDQFQYYGLATPFKEFAVTEGLYYNHFEPFNVSLTGELVKNVAFDRSSIGAVARSAARLRPKTMWSYTPLKSIAKSQVTLNTRPPKVTISTWPTATVPAIARKVGFCKMRWKPLTLGVSDRQLIWFQT